MKKTNYTQTLSYCALFLFCIVNQSSIFAQCNFSDYNKIKITAGTDAVFQVDEVPDYQPVFNWDYTDAPTEVTFSNGTVNTIEISVDPFAVSSSFWLKFSYDDVNCIIEDSIELNVVGIDQFQLNNAGNIICGSDLNTPITLQTDLNLTNLEFDILDDLGNPLFSNVNNWPLGLVSGDYLMQVYWTQFVESCPACLVLTDNQVKIPFHFGDNTSDALVCNDNIQVSVDEFCGIDVTVDMLAEAVQGLDAGSILITFFDGLEVVHEPGSDYIGETLEFVLEDVCSENSCWGSLIIEDKIAPVFDQQDITVNQFCGMNQTIPQPAVSDNCGGLVSVQLISSEVEDFDCSNINGLIQIETRTYIATDASGNVSSTFEQEIYTRIPTLAEIVFPTSYNDVQAPSLRCTDAGETDPVFTGYPSAFGVDFIPGQDYCGISAAFSDQVFDGCGEGFTILRKWVILRSCNQGSELLEYDQMIAVKDQIEPYIQCPPVIEVNVSSEDCLLESWLPNLFILDDCSDVSWTIGGDSWLVEQGETLPPLDIGIHTLTINANDDCGNQSLCNTSLELTDGLSPTAVCIELTEVSLNSEGIAVMDALSADNGSYDNCSEELIYQIRKMGDVYAASVEFDCEDYLESNNSFLPIELLITDEVGNTNSCMVQVTISDKIYPEITCSDVTGFDCTDLSIVEDLWADISYSDNCTATISYGETDYTGLNTDCYVGQVTRKVTVEDLSGNVASCNQSIFFSGTNPLTDVSIDWPEDLFFESCVGVAYNPDSIGLDIGIPEISIPMCGLTGVNYSDQLFYTGGDECFKILRTWTVMDWCHFDPNTGAGVFDHIQEIRVQDNEAPVVDCDIVPFVKLSTPDCFGEITLELPYIIEECSEVNIEVSSILGDGIGPFQDVGLGNYMVTYTISDACGNTTNCLVDYQVSDAREPTAYCIDQLVIDLPQELEVTIVASDFDFASFDNCTQEDELLFAFSALSFDSLRTFDCTHLGVNEVEMYVFDAEGNFDRCSVSLLLQDNNNFCGNNQLTLSGYVADRFNEPVADVVVERNGTDQYFAVSLDDGSYLFDDVNPATDYTLKADYLDDSPIGEDVTTFDMVLITRHILGQELFDSPYQWIAADVNDSGTISTLDIVAIRKVILQIESEFPNGKRWKFIDRSFAFSGSMNPLLAGYPELINLNNINSDYIDLDFVAIRMGDVN